MSDFPRTTIGGRSLSRLAAGTNWFLGFSHQTQARSKHIKEIMTRERIAGILEVFLRNGIDAVFGGAPGDQHLTDAIKDAEQRVGRSITRICIPTLMIKDGPEALDQTARRLDEFARMGTHICMPHQNSTDPLIDRRNRRITNMDVYLKMIRERGMIPGLSTHTPDAPIYADETGLDVETYVQIYNAAGFLMQIEVDWVHRQIWNRKKPVLTIKPLAAGRLQPLEGLAFAWATLRDCDVVTVGTQSADEAEEVIEISRALFERRAPRTELQRTRSKQSIDGK